MDFTDHALSPPVLSVASWRCLGWMLTSSLQPITLSNVTWGTGNRAYYFPFTIERPMRVTQAFWLNGSAANTGSINVGVFNRDGVSLFTTGAITQAGGTSITQYTTLGTPYYLRPGAYFLGMLASSGSTSVLAWNFSEDRFIQCSGIYRSTAFTSPVTFAASGGLFIPFVGLSTL